MLILEVQNLLLAKIEGNGSKDFLIILMTFQQGEILVGPDSLRIQLSKRLMKELLVMKNK